MKYFFLISALTISIYSCQHKSNVATNIDLIPAKGQAIAVFAEGCFWCSEHIFEAIPGVIDAVSGYAGGKTLNPTYEQVCSETTGHAESVAVYYNPTIVTYAELVQVFFDSHNPTTVDQQGPDKGSSYRSIAFFQNQTEKNIIEAAIVSFNASKRFNSNAVTQILPLKVFYKAEKYHQDYINQNPGNPYVQNVSLPRFEQFKKTYKGKLKE